MTGSVLDKRRLQFVVDHRELVHELNAIQSRSPKARALCGHLLEFGHLTRQELRFARALIFEKTGKVVKLDEQEDHGFKKDDEK